MQHFMKQKLAIMFQSLKTSLTKTLNLKMILVDLVELQKN